MAKERLDQLLFRRGLCDSRETAKRLILAGEVRVEGLSGPLKPGQKVEEDLPIEVKNRPRYVGRGGFKLEGALDAFGLEVSGKVALDAGASTGGFTDCLLQRGAAAVVAIDVGRNQLHERLRADPRVDVREQTNIRHVAPADVGGPVPLVVADLSFISLRTVLERVLALVAPGGSLVALVKPQFEAGRAEVSRGRGVITDPSVWRRVLDELGHDLSSQRAAMMGVMVSPITGADGNVEFLAHIARPAEHPGAPLVDAAALATVVEQATLRGRPTR